MSTTVEAPPPRNLAQETGDTLQTQIALAPQQLAAYQQTAPGYAATDINILGRSLFGDDFSGNLSDINNRLTGEAAAQSQQATTAQRAADLADVQAMGGTVQGIQRGANTELFGNLSRLDSLAAAGAPAGAAESAFANQAMQGSGANLSLGSFNPTMVSTPFAPQPVSASFSPESVSTSYAPPTLSTSMTEAGAPSEIEAALQGQALSELALGDQLSADEARQVRVQSRAAADARGRGFSNAALADEVLNTASARQARATGRRGFALETNSAIRAGQAADRSYSLARDQFRSDIERTQAGLGLSAAQLASENQRFNAGLGLSAAQLASENQRFNSGLGLSAAQLTSENQRFNSGLGLSAAQLNSGNRLAEAQFTAGRTDADRAALSRAAEMEAARRNEGFNRTLSATQARLATFTDPFQGVLGRSSSNFGTNQQLFGNAAGTAGASASATRGMFDPFNGYAADLYNTNYNAQAAANIATANNRAGILGAALGGLGAIGGAYFGG